MTSVTNSVIAITNSVTAIGFSISSSRNYGSHLIERDPKLEKLSSREVIWFLIVGYTFYIVNLYEDN
jgi:hypothetical protein